MRTKPDIPVDVVKELFNLVDGVLYWKKKVARKVVVGDPAGQMRHDGYVLVGFGGTVYLAHRIIFAIVNGFYPDEVDHADGNPRNNDPANLREATRSQNNMNRALQCNNTSGYKGVYLNKRIGMWHARIKVGGKYMSLKYHKTVELAAEAYNKAQEQYHGAFARGAY